VVITARRRPYKVTKLQRRQQWQVFKTCTVSKSATSKNGHAAAAAAAAAAATDVFRDFSRCLKTHHEMLDRHVTRLFHTMAFLVQTGEKFIDLSGWEFTMKIWTGNCERVATLSPVKARSYSVELNQNVIR
jgi:hypothetical protein